MTFYTNNPYPLNGNHRALFERQLRQFIEPLAPRRILDAGCGTGSMSADLAAHFPQAHVHAVDRSGTSLALARQRYGALPNLTFSLIDLECDELPAVDPFDFVFCQGVLHHMQDPSRALRNIVKAVCPSATVYVWLYSEHGRTEISLVRHLLSMLAGPSTTTAHRIEVLELLRPQFLHLYQAEEEDLASWTGQESSWTSDQERHARYLDRYLNPVADHFSVRAADRLFCAASLRIVSAPTLDYAESIGELKGRLQGIDLDLVEYYAALEMLVRPWGIGYLLRAIERPT